LIEIKNTVIFYY